MRATTFFAACAAATLATASPRTAQLYYQPVTAASATAPLPLANIEFDPQSPESATVISYEAPVFLSGDDDDDDGGRQSNDATPDTGLVRIGLYDPKTSAWLSSASVTSKSTFSKGYSPHLLLTVDTQGTVLGAGARGVLIDAGVTRDFGPQAVVQVTGKGKTPQAGKPVVLAPDGRRQQPEPEKSLLQKYWWVLAILALLTLGGGGDGK